MAPKRHPKTIQKRTKKQHEKRTKKTIEKRTKHEKKNPKMPDRAYQNLTVSPPAPPLRSTSWNAAQLSAALRKLRAAFRQISRCRSVPRNLLPVSPPAPPLRIRFAELSATLSRSPQAPRRFPSSPHAANLPYIFLTVSPPAPPLKIHFVECNATLSRFPLRSKPLSVIRACRPWIENLLYQKQYVLTPLKTPLNKAFLHSLLFLTGARLPAPLADPEGKKNCAQSLVQGPFQRS